mmetsp:Transcript_17373/g.48986  ORF Transcript_17373/g.48986 Transcript_17373/m.48986 type:complete len:303 (+) Transcript_17373:413-1321(+)
MGRQRAAVLRISGQLRRVHRSPATARPHHGIGLAKRRPPDSRILHLLQEGGNPQGRFRHIRLLRIAPVPRPSRNRTHRLRPARARCLPLQAGHDHCRRIGLPARLRLRQIQGDRRCQRMPPHDGHGAHLRTGRHRRTLVSIRVLRHRHHHHAQIAARTTCRNDLLPQGRPRLRGKDQPGRLPRPPGWTARAPDRRCRHPVEGGHDPGIQGVLPASQGQRQGPCRQAHIVGILHGIGRHGESPRALGLEAKGHHGKQVREDVRCRLHHAEQELRAGRQIRHHAGWCPNRRPRPHHAQDGRIGL